MSARRKGGAMRHRPTPASRNACRDFSAATLRALLARGVEVVGASSVGTDGSVGYHLVVDGELRVRSHADVLRIARS